MVCFVDARSGTRMRRTSYKRSSNKRRLERCIAEETGWLNKKLKKLRSDTRGLKLCAV
jgi:hypothetical protein